MEQQFITDQQIAKYEEHLRQSERSAATIEKYIRDVRAFSTWLGKEPVNSENAIRWKCELLDRSYAPATINSMIAALNGFFTCHGISIRLKQLRVQRRMFRDEQKDLNRKEFSTLVEAAQVRGKGRLALLMETICATGIRVSEVKYITVEAVQAGHAQISLKGKLRTILMPGKLCRKLLKYAKKQKITSGEIFLTRGGNSISRKQIWAEMKALCKAAGVDPGKVFPHNLRHLFAQCFYRACKDIVKLADTLGHSSVETTRIYLLSTGAEHTRVLEQLRLIS